MVINNPSIQVIKSPRMRWAGHVVRMWERRGVFWVLVRKPEGKRPLQDPGVAGRIISSAMWGIGLD